MTHRFPLSTLLLAALTLVTALLADDPTAAKLPRPAKSPVSPEDSLKYFQLEPGLKIELVACEPEVIDPVAIRFDEDGRMWVVEMRDYPNGPPAGSPPLSRIKVLEDRDGDGRFETATVFADKLLFATGVQPWKGGVFVTLSGRVAYMKDTDGDGRADLDETWYTGFTEENPQLRANHPTFAIDNLIYIANGLRGGKVVDVSRPNDPPIDISGRDFRFDPLTRKCEAVSGVGQFGMSFDDYGNRFVCDNRHPVQHVVLPDDFLRRNQHVTVPAVMHDVAASGEKSRIFPLSRAWTTSTQHAGQFTAACGVTIYRGNGLNTTYYGNAFTCDPTGNLVHREIVSRLGATFVSKPKHDGKEFLASTDEWFRPVNLEVGPDGMLYVVDMYRAVIEHPQFVPDELRHRPDERWGDDRGRIYRVTWHSHKFPTPLSKLTQELIVAELGSTNAWRRETAGRLIFERQDKSIAPALRDLLQSVNVRGTMFPHIGAQCLSSLHGLGELKDDDIANVIKKAGGELEAFAINLGNGRGLQTNFQSIQVAAQPPSLSEPTFVALMRVLPSGKGNFPIGFFLRPIPAEDVWVRRSLTLAASRQASSVLSHLLKGPQFDKPSSGFVSLVEEISELAALESHQDAADFVSALKAVANFPNNDRHARLPQAAVRGLARGFSRKRTNLAAGIAKAPPEIRVAIEKQVADAGDMAWRFFPKDVRLDSIRLLSYGTDDKTLALLAVDEPDQEIRLTAIDALARTPSVEPFRGLLGKFQAELPVVRRALLDAAIPRAERAAILLDEIEAKRIKSSELDPIRTDRLLKHGDAKIRERAVKLFADAIPQDRAKVLADYQPVLQLKGDPQRGLEVFKKNCATCHRIGEVGVNVAPDIADSRVKTPAQLLTDILQPNRAIDGNYISYTVVAEDGRILTGLLGAETATSITLRQPEGKTVTLARSEISELKSNGVSLMPEGLEKTIPPADMADLISFVKNWRYLDGQTPIELK